MNFTYNSARARQARLGRVYGGPLNIVLRMLALVAVLAGAFLLVEGQAIGWFVISIAGPLFALALWGATLRQLPVGKDGSVDALLETALLAALPMNPTPKQLAELVITQPGGRFFANRFLLGSDFIVQIASDSSDMTPAVWQKAAELRQQTAAAQITSGAVTAAIILTSPDINQYLPHVGLNTDDIVDGVLWLAHIEQLQADLAGNKRRSGGIGRDWAFGFTPLLERFGHNISEGIAAGGLLARKLEGRQETLKQMASILSQTGRRNVVLVGQLGSGKSKLVQMFAQMLLAPDASVPQPLRYNQIVALDASTLISAAQGRGQLEELVIRLASEAIYAKNILLFLDDAHLFFEEGNGSVDLTTVLTPILDGGALKLIMAVDEQRWTQITQRNSSLVQYLNRVVVQPAGKQETREVLHNQALLFEHQYGVLYSYQAIEAAYDLSSRYVGEQVMPGRALSVMESAAHFAEDKLVTRKSVEQAIEQTRGVKVSTADTAAERDTLLNLEDRIHERMINQSHAVKAVSDALRRARAGVRNTQRPIGTFLFLGPTGVGKTELAKSIAAVFFGHEDSLVRLDLNEYVRSEDVARLIADPAQDSRSLTAQIARNPFSVVLLDEIEKAHPEVLNTLLQLLDEGILRDINNREVSFRDSVIIATSNAGAEKIIAHIQSGEALEQFEERFTSELIESGIFKPEFLNRFDEITLFRPLTPDELKQVVDIILRGVNQNLTAQKLTVAVDEDAKTLLVETGNDPRLGARPMRRIVQKTVENIVADKVLRQEALPGSTITITRADIAAILEK